MTKYLFLALLLWGAGCSHQQQVIDKFIVQDGKLYRISHDIISNTNVLYWSKYKGLTVTRPDVTIVVNDSEKKPEMSELVSLIQAWLGGGL